MVDINFSLLYRKSFDAVADPPSVDVLSNAGTCALALGRNLLAGDEAESEEAAGLFTDGISWLRLAIQRAEAAPATVRENFNPVMAHSRLGEIALRAYPLTWNQDLLDTAVEHLGTARDLGENAVESTGLLGDAHYRRGSRQNDVNELERAVHFKDEAFASGALERENRSLAAAATIKLFGLTGDVQLLTNATVRALQSVRCDPSWPWAVIQLAELAASAPALDVSVVSAEEPRELAAWVAGGNRDELLRRAAELAVHTKEFSASVLGGSSGPANAVCACSTTPTGSLSRRSCSRGSHGPMLTANGTSPPRSADGWRPRRLRRLGIAATARCRRRNRRRQRVRDATRAGQGSRRVSRRMEELPRGGPTPAVPGGAQISGRLPSLARHIRRYVRTDVRSTRARGVPGAAGEGRPQTGPGREDPHATHRAVRGLRRRRHAGGREEGPHPGNWLWSSRGELVLIDVESTGALPLLQEAVTIIDDLPLFELTHQGWEDRAALCRVYIDALHDFGFPHFEERFPLMEHYEAMAVLHVIKGLARLRTADPGVSSFSLKARWMQSEHYRNLLVHLRESAVRAELRDLARRIDL